MGQINDQNILLKAQLTAASANSNNVVHQNGYGDHHQQQQQSNRIQELEHQIMVLTHDKAHSETKITFYEAENARLINEIEQFKTIKIVASEVDQLKNEKSEWNAKIEKMNKDQDDLLELLADQDLKIKEYTKRLKNLGQQVEEDEDDEEEA